MCVYVHMHDIHTHTHIYACTYMHVYVCMYVCIHMYIHKYIYTNARACTHARADTFAPTPRLFRWRVPAARSTVALLQQNTKTSVQKNVCKNHMLLGTLLYEIAPCTRTQCSSSKLPETRIHQQEHVARAPFTDLMLHASYETEV
jgi:hypothetical protein